MDIIFMYSLVALLILAAWYWKAQADNNNEGELRRLRTRMLARSIANILVTGCLVYISHGWIQYLMYLILTLWSFSTVWNMVQLVLNWDETGSYIPKGSHTQIDPKQRLVFRCIDCRKVHKIHVREVRSMHCRCGANYTFHWSLGEVTYSGWYSI